MKVFHVEMILPIFDGILPTRVILLQYTRYDAFFFQNSVFLSIHASMLRSSFCTESGVF